MKDVQMKIYRSHPDAQLPAPATKGDAGLDLVAVDSGSCYIQGELAYVSYGTGIQVVIPEGMMGLVCARSSVSSRGICLSNGVGIIDSGYRGEITLRFSPLLPAEKASFYQLGEKIGQLILIPIPAVILEEVYEESALAASERGKGGWGSTSNTKLEVTP